MTEAACSLIVIDDHPLLRKAIADLVLMSPQLSFSGEASTVPSLMIRSLTSNRHFRGTSVNGFSAFQSNRLGRICLPISRTSRHPLEVIKAVLAPFRSIRLFVAMVVP